MKFRETKLKGSYIIEFVPMEDERGFFARNFCQEEFAARGLKTKIVQSNISYNRTKGTVRGMHYQTSPHEEAKLLFCTKGAIHDVIVDIREESSTYCQWLNVELREENNMMLYVPEGFAHGFQTLKDNTTIFYQMFGLYHAESSSGIRWDDPYFNINWPIKNPTLSKQDRNWPYWK